MMLHFNHTTPHIVTCHESQYEQQNYITINLQKIITVLVLPPLALTGVVADPLKID